MFDFDSVPDRRQSASLKWDRYAGRDIIPMWVADMDFPAPPAVISALQARIAHGIFGYSSLPPELVQTVVEAIERDHQWQIQPEWIVWLPGLVSGLNLVCRAIGNDDDNVLTTTPIYPPFLSAPGYSRRSLGKVPLAELAGHWELDFDRLEQTVRPNSRLFLLCNPHNPVGRVWSRQELLRLAEFCTRHDLVICSDEIHCALVLDRDKAHTPIAMLSSEIAARTITLMAPSKTFNLPGLGCAFAIVADSRLRARLHRTSLRIVPHVNMLGYFATLAAYRDGEPWRQELLDYLRINRDLVERMFAELPGCRVTHAEASYLSWIDVREAALERPVEFFEKAGVGLYDGAEFDAPGFVRLNFGCPRALLRQALERIQAAFSPYGRGC